MSGIRCVLVALMVLMVARGAYAQCPGFPSRGVQVIDALYDGRLAWGSDDDRRQLTRMVIEQLVYDFPAEGWTWKSADPGRPPSKDSIARVYGGRLCNWDWQNGATRERSVNVGDVGVDITGQNPIPVAGVNRMVSAPQQPQQPQSPAAVDYDRIRVLVGLEVAPILTYLANIKDNDAAIRGDIAAVSEQVKVHDEKTNVIIGWLKNAKTYLIAGSGLAGWLLPKVLASQPQPQGAK